MNYTEKHHLPQWAKEDRIMMKDFNDAMASIEDGLVRGPAKVAEEAARANEKTAQAASAAQAAADRAAAAAAQAKADKAYSPDQPPYVVGTYKGNGDYQRIELGFRPRFVIIGGARGANQHLFSRVVGGASGSGNVSFSNTGFTVGRNGSEGGSGSESAPQLMEPGMEYGYIAFR